MKVIKILPIVVMLVIITGCSKEQEFLDIYRCLYAAQNMNKFQEAESVANYLEKFTKEHMANVNQFEMIQLRKNVQAEFDLRNGTPLNVAMTRLNKAYNSSYCKKIYNK